MNVDNILNTIIQGDSLDVLKQIPSESVDMCITSPPYWGLRDYNNDKQLGQEKDFNEYINKLCNIFDEIQRVLIPNGTCWVNLGDTYKDKNLLQIPNRFAIEMCDRGWILRNEIIWHKPNAMPQNVKDRFTVDFEKLFLFVKSKKYYFKTQKEENKDTYGGKRGVGKRSKLQSSMQTELTKDKIKSWSTNGRNKRCVWSINTKGIKQAHFAIYPEELIETPIKAGCPDDGIVMDIFMGSGTTGVVAKKLNRNYIGIELNKEYINIANERIFNEVINGD